MRILSIFLFVVLMLMAFFSPAAAKQSAGGAPAKSADYQRHIFKKRDADFEEYVDEAI